MKKGAIKRGICLFLIVLLVSLVPRYDQIAEKVDNLFNADVIVIDPGHGGVDGGASSSQGALEKDINLAIAQEVKTQAEAMGFKVVMTRDVDVSLGDDQLTIRSKKIKDLKVRRELIEEIDPLAAISIHLNSFTQDASVHGMQVFYPPSGGETEDLTNSKKLASMIQDQGVVSLQKDKKRMAMPKNNVYLLKQIYCPIAIVECGFLSNSLESNRLQDTKYQQEIAKVIIDGLMKYSDKKPPKKIKVIENSSKGRQ